MASYYKYMHLLLPGVILPILTSFIIWFQWPSPSHLHFTPWHERDKKVLELTGQAVDVMGSYAWADCFCTLVLCRPAGIPSPHRGHSGTKGSTAGVKSYQTKGARQWIPHLSPWPRKVGRSTVLWCYYLKRRHHRDEIHQRKRWKVARPVKSAAQTGLFWGVIQMFTRIFLLVGLKEAH